MLKADTNSSMLGAHGSWRQGVMRSYPAVLLAVLLGAAPAMAGVSAGEAEALKSTLTPLGGERAGNSAGTIPAWTGGATAADPNYRQGAPRPDPFAADKPLFSITRA